jgi:hypothetical protein
MGRPGTLPKSVRARIAADDWYANYQERQRIERQRDH